MSSAKSVKTIHGVPAGVIAGLITFFVGTVVANKTFVFITGITGGIGVPFLFAVATLAVIYFFTRSVLRTLL